MVPRERFIVNNTDIIAFPSSPTAAATKYAFIFDFDGRGAQFVFHWNGHGLFFRIRVIRDDDEVFGDYFPLPEEPITIRNFNDESAESPDLRFRFIDFSDGTKPLTIHSLATSFVMLVETGRVVET